MAGPRSQPSPQLSVLKWVTNRIVAPCKAVFAFRFASTVAVRKAGTEPLDGLVGLGVQPVVADSDINDERH